MKRSVSVVIVDERGKILVLKRAPGDKMYPEFWDFPGGRVEGNETLNEAAKREVAEESGLNVEPSKDYFKTNKYKDGEINYVFKANFSGGNVKVSPEHTEFAWVSKTDWKNLEYTPEVELAVKSILLCDS